MAPQENDLLPADGKPACGAAPTRRIARPTAQRLTEYLIILEELRDRGEAVVSSRQLANIYGNNANQVRQDLSCLGHTGRVSQGYAVPELEQTIRRVLGLTSPRGLVLVGCGRLGTTLALHVPLTNYGMELVAAFDVLPGIVGTKLGPVTIEDAARIPAVCRERNVELGVLAVPKTAAQEAADLLVAGGVLGILNYTRVMLRVPPHVYVQNRQLVCSFIQLFYSTFSRERLPGAAEPAPTGN